MGWREDKISKLRAKAASTPFAAERSAFNRKAKQLEWGAIPRPDDPRAQAYSDGAVIFDRIGDQASANWCREHALDIRAGIA